MKKYLSTRIFKNWIYSVSHSTLIIRSEMKVDDYEGNPTLENHTLDIEFWGVTYLDIPVNYDGISVRIKQDDKSKFNKYLSYEGDNIFEIETNGTLYHIVASGCIVGKSTWINQDRIQNLFLKYDEVVQKF